MSLGYVKYAYNAIEMNGVVCFIGIYQRGLLCVTRSTAMGNARSLYEWNG